MRSVDDDAAAIERPLRHAAYAAPASAKCLPADYVAATIKIFTLAIRHERCREALHLITGHCR